MLRHASHLGPSIYLARVSRILIITTSPLTDVSWKARSDFQAESRTYSAGSVLVAVRGMSKSNGLSKQRSAEARRGGVMGRKSAEAGSADARRMECWALGEMPGAPVSCAVWVPQVGKKSHLVPQFSSLCRAGLILCLEKLCAYQRNAFFKCHPMRVYKQEAEGVQLGKK